MVKYGLEKVLNNEWFYAKRIDSSVLYFHLLKYQDNISLIISDIKNCHKIPRQLLHTVISGFPPVAGDLWYGGKKEGVDSEGRAETFIMSATALTSLISTTIN
jgi:hypothetical protein